MPRNPSLTLLATAILSISACAPACAHSQALLRRQTPPPTPTPAPALTGVSAWPDPATLKPGTRMMVSTFSDPGTPYLCQLQAIDDTRILCGGRHGARNTSFDRNIVATIMLQSGHQVRVSTVLVATGSTCLFVAWLIAIHHTNGGGGGSANADLAETGLTFITAGIIARPFDALHGPRYQTPIYIAPRPAYPIPAGYLTPLSPPAQVNP